MQVIRDTVIITHLRLAALHEIDIPVTEAEFETVEYDSESDPEDVEHAREFPAQTGRCPLAERLRTLAVRCMPPTLPSFMRILFVVWMVWCGLLRQMLPLLLGSERFQSVPDALMLTTA